MYRYQLTILSMLAFRVPKCAPWWVPWYLPPPCHLVWKTENTLSLAVPWYTTSGSPFLSSTLEACRGSLIQSPNHRLKLGVLTANHCCSVRLVSLPLGALSHCLVPWYFLRTASICFCASGVRVNASMSMNFSSSECLALKNGWW